MFKRIIYFFVIIIAVFVLSFITREIVVSTACRSGDSKSVYREFDGMDSGHILPISNESEPELPSRGNLRRLEAKYGLYEVPQTQARKS